MSAATENREHPTATKSGMRYLFTAKHHGMDKAASQWLPSISDDEEFSIFETADEHEISDDRGSLFGVLGDGKGGKGPGNLAATGGNVPGGGREYSLARLSDLGIEWRGARELDGARYAPVEGSFSEARKDRAD